jgi:hypothetical protein
MNKAVDLAPFKMIRKIATERRARIALIVESFPEADTVAAGNHLSLEVRQKRFGWYLDNHHADGRLAIDQRQLKLFQRQLKLFSMTIETPVL